MNIEWKLWRIDDGVFSWKARQMESTNRTQKSYAILLFLYSCLMKYCSNNESWDIEKGTVNV